MAELTPSESSLVTAFVGAMEARDAKAKEDSNSEIRLVKKLIRLKDIGIAILFFGSLIAAGVVTFGELADKPTVEQMQEAVEVRVAPVEEAVEVNAKSVKQIEHDVADIATDVARTKDVQQVVLEQGAHQSEVLDHIASKRQGKPPAKPESLKRAERGLIQ